MTNSFFNMVTGNNNQPSDNQPISVTQPNDSQSDTLIDNSVIETTIENSGNIDTATNTSQNSQDSSDMPHDARRALVYLSQQGVVLASQKPQLFNNIVRHQSRIRRHLSELYCSLIIDEHSGVAFVARSDFTADNHEHIAGLEDLESESEQQELADEDVSSLIQKRTLTVYDTLLLLTLRKYYQERQNLGETEIIIDIEKLESLMSPFLPLTDHGSKDKKKLSNRLDHFTKQHKLLIAKRATKHDSSQERYEITPMIRYVVNASLLQAMLNEYKALVGEDMAEESHEAMNEDFEQENHISKQAILTQKSESIPLSDKQDKQENIQESLF